MPQEVFSGELGELAAPEVVAQDALGRHPQAADQHPVGLLEIADGDAIRQKLGVGEHRKTSAARGRVAFFSGEDGGDHLGGAHLGADAGRLGGAVDAVDEDAVSLWNVAARDWGRGRNTEPPTRRCSSGLEQAGR